MTSLAPNFDVREEIRLLQVLEPFRPVGPEKHFYLASILQEHGLIEPLCRRSTLWSFISKLYDLEKLNDLHYLQLEEDEHPDLGHALIHEILHKGEGTQKDYSYFQEFQLSSSSNNLEQNSDLMQYFFSRYHDDERFDSVSDATSEKSEKSLLESTTSSKSTLFEVRQKPPDSTAKRKTPSVGRISTRRSSIATSDFEEISATPSKRRPKRETRRK